MLGSEYLGAEVLAGWWSDLDSLVRGEIAHHPGGVQAYLSELNPQWRLVGRVTFHLAENKRDPGAPVRVPGHLHSQAFGPGTRAARAAGQGTAAVRRRQEPVEPAVAALAHPAREPSAAQLVKEMVESREIYHPLAWTPREAYRFLQDIPVFEESGLVVRVPDWWKPNQPPRAVVNVKIDARKGSKLSVRRLA